MFCLHAVLYFADQAINTSSNLIIAQFWLQWVRKYKVKLQWRGWKWFSCLACTGPGQRWVHTGPPGCCPSSSQPPAAGPQTRTRVQILINIEIRAGAYILVSKRYLFSPQPFQKWYFSPSPDTSFFDSYSVLPSFFPILHLFYTFTVLRNFPFSLYLPLSSFFLPFSCPFLALFLPFSCPLLPLSFPFIPFFLCNFPHFSLPLFVFFPQMTSADISPTWGRWNFQYIHRPLFRGLPYSIILASNWPTGKSNYALYTYKK